MERHFDYIRLLFVTTAVFIILPGCRLSQTNNSETSAPRVHAQMYIKGEPSAEGFLPCHAEGKYYGIRAMDSVTFFPGEDSFHQMHHHGVALESEQMAYRIYFDKRQTMDVYAKRHPRLELATSRWYPNDSLLALGYGDDVLKVGNTIGVGSVRPYDYMNERLLNMDKFESRTQRIVCLTADSAVVETEVRGLTIQDGDSVKTTDLTTRYTILSGHRDMRCEVFCTTPIHCLTTGVQKTGNGKSMQLSVSQGTTLLSWGTDWPVNDTIKYGKETIGLAVYVPEAYTGKVFTDQQQQLCPLRLDTTGYCRFYLTAVALKEDNPPATNFGEFLRYIRLWMPSF